MNSKSCECDACVKPITTTLVSGASLRKRDLFAKQVLAFDCWKLLGAPAARVTKRDPRDDKAQYMHDLGDAILPGGAPLNDIIASHRNGVA